MPDITKQPYLNIIKLYTMLKVIDPIKIIANVNVHNKNKYMENFKDYELLQTGGGTTKIKIKGNEFDFNSFHMKNMAFYNLLTPDEQSCIAIEIDKINGIAHIESLQFSEKCFVKCATEKNGSILLKACLKLLNTIKDEYKLRYVWLQDSSEKYCAKVKSYIHLDSFYMLLHGDTWYGKYGFVPFKISKNGKAIVDSIERSKYKENQKIVRETLIEDTQIGEILINTIKKHKLKLSVHKLKNILEKNGKITINQFFKNLMKEFDNTCELFFYSYDEIMYKCRIHNLHDRKYWLEL